jgi:hypothetical protein
LTREEFDDRLDQAWAARTAEDLEPLFHDLPDTASERTPARFDRRAPVGFGYRNAPSMPIPGRRMPFRLLPLIMLALLAVLILNGITPFLLFGLAFLWFVGVVGRCRSGRGPRAYSR